MAVEILILSGARQGERIVLDANTFRVGTNPDCAVYFDPLLDASAANRSASFSLMDDGWYIVHAAGAILVNQRAVAGPTRIRSGDVVRMSERGPDFSFSLVASAAPRLIKSPVQPTSSPPPILAQQEVLTPSTVPMSDLVAPPQSATPVTSSVVPTFVVMPPIEQSGYKTGTKDLPAPVNITINTGNRENWILLVVCAAVACLGLILYEKLGLPSSGNGSAPLDKTGNQNLQDQKFPQPPPPSTPPPATQPTREEQIAAQIKDKEVQITTQIKDAVYLIQVETAGRFWPFATCSAIGKNTLLTSAREAYILSDWRNDPQNGFKIWITNPASGIQMAVQDIYLNAVFTTIDDKFTTIDYKPNDWNYYDLALITVAEELPNVIPLASPEEISEGLFVYCYGFTHEGKKITKSSSFQPQLMPGEIYLITAHPNLPFLSRLLHIKGKIFKNAFGSPIVNDQGKLVAVYGSEEMHPEHAEGEYPDPNALKIHYAPVLEPKLIKLGLDHQDSKIWVSPDFKKNGSEPKDEK